MNLLTKITISKEKDVPQSYWIPKMYKNSCDTTFVIPSKLWSTKQFSKSTPSVFTLSYNEIESFHKKVKFLTSYNNIWLLPISDSIINPTN